MDKSKKMQDTPAMSMKPAREPKHAKPKLTRKERRQAWASLSKGNEHPDH